MREVPNVIIYAGLEIVFGFAVVLNSKTVKTLVVHCGVVLFLRAGSRGKNTLVKIMNIVKFCHYLV